MYFCNLQLFLSSFRNHTGKFGPPFDFADEAAKKWMLSAVARRHTVLPVVTAQKFCKEDQSCENAICCKICTVRDTKIIYRAI